MLLITSTVQAADYSRQTVSLNGIWDFYPNGGVTKYPITVPSYWDDSSAFGYPSSWDSLNYGVYDTSFTVPSVMSEKEIFLNLDNVSNISKVFVNGTQVGGETTGGYLMMSIPYQLDVSSLVNIGGSNTLEVKVWGSSAFPSDAKNANGNKIYPTGVDTQS